MTLQDHLSTWENLRLAYQNASRGKRGQPAAAGFELYLADHLLNDAEQPSSLGLRIFNHLEIIQNENKINLDPQNLVEQLG